MSEDFIRIMHALFLPGAESCRDSPWCPPADVYRGRNGWLVKFELAGVRPEDLELTVHGNRLTLRGVRRDCTALEGCRYYQMEIAYSHFERSLDAALRPGTGRHHHGIPRWHVARSHSRWRRFVTPSDNVVVLPVLPLKNTVLFPHLFMPLSVGRPNSMAAIEAVLATEEKSFVVVAQRDADNEQPGLDDLCTPSAPAPSSRRWRAARASSSCSSRASSASAS